MGLLGKLFDITVRNGSLHIWSLLESKANKINGTILT